MKQSSSRLKLMMEFAGQYEVICAGCNLLGFLYIPWIWAVYYPNRIVFTKCTGCKLKKTQCGVSMSMSMNGDIFGLMV